MSHLPKNHHLRPLYRTLAFFAGLYCLLFGIVGVARTAGHSLFGQSPTWALGLRTNLAFAIVSIIVGAAVLITTIIGRNVDQKLNIVLGPVFIIMGLLMMTIMRSFANFLNFGMSTCIVSFAIGLVLLASGLFGEVSDEDHAILEEHHRHGGASTERQPLQEQLSG